MSHDKDYAPSATEYMVARDAALHCLTWTTALDTEEGSDINGYYDAFEGFWSNDARARMLEVITDFIDSNSDSLHELTYSDIGHNFILSANGHGAGFWDMGMGKTGDSLHDAAVTHGTFSIWHEGDTMNLEG